MSEEARGAPSTLDLREFLGIVRRRKWSVTAVAAVTLAVALAFLITATPIYSATAEVLVKPVSPAQSLQNVPLATLINLNNEQVVAQSPAVAEGAAKTLDYRGPLKDLLTKVSVTIPGNTQVLDITFSDPSPSYAQRGAAAFAQSYLDFRGQQAIDAYKNASRGMLQQITKLQGNLNQANRTLTTQRPGSALQAQTQQQISMLSGQLAVLENQVAPLLSPEVDPGTVIAPSTIPSSPSSPRIRLLSALALLSGLALGIAVAVLRERLDDRISSREELEEVVGAPTLAIVPKVGDWKKRSATEVVTLAAPKSPPSEAYRTIRTNLQYIARGDSFKILAVTSPLLGEGKTTTVANIAVTLAQTNKRVIAVSADLRKPRLHRFFGLENDSGVTSILTGQTTLAEAALRVAAVETLRVLPSGPIPPNPADLLSSPEMEQLMADLRRYADFVVIDTPPVLAVADALILGPRSDGVLIVADASSSTRKALEHLREQLEQVHANIVGSVYNNFDPSTAKYYPSYYRYYYSYRYASEPAKEKVAGNGGEIHKVTDPEDMWRRA